MKNVVKKFIGRSEKELNPELISMAAYYGYQINVTNCFSGNRDRKIPAARRAVFRAAKNHERRERSRTA